MFVARRELALILAGSVAPCLLLLTGAARAPASSTMEAQEFVVKDAEGRTCARLGLADMTEGLLQFYDRSGGRCRMEVGLVAGGVPRIRFVEETSDEPSTGSEILIEDDCGDPGETSIQLLSKPDHDGKRGMITIRMGRGGDPEIVATSKSGKTTSLIPAK